MNPVISVNLNGNAYQIEEAGYTLLRAYLDRAAAALKGNPDEAEILADLEQAIADKCQRGLGPNKTVVTAAEMTQVLAEMGPVDAANGDGAQADAASPKTEPAGAASGDAEKAKRLYQIKEGAMISGVCTGLSAYLHVDVTIIRIAFLILAYWGGVGIGAYILLMVVIPKATTDEQVAAAHGEPFNAREVIDHAKRISEDIKSNTSQWRKHVRQQQRHWRRQMRHARAEHATLGAGAGGGLFMFAGFVFLMFTLIAVAKSGTFWGMPLPMGIPQTVVIAGLFLACFMIFAPRGLRGTPAAPAPVSPATPVLNLLSAAWLILLIVALVSLFRTHAIFHWPIPSGVPLWAAAVVVLIVYQLVAAPLMIGRGAVRADGVAGLVAGGIVCWLLYENVAEVRVVVDRVWERMQ
jgi:phage shock protein PspC (stress-responsive transcriptional regulator)